MRDHRALGKRRRARGVEDREHIVGADGSRGARDVAQQVGGAVASRIDVGRIDDHVAQLGKARATELAGHGVGQLGQHLLERVEVIDRTESIGEEQRRRVRLTENVGELVGAIARIERDDDQPEAGRGVLRDEPQRSIRQPDGQRVAPAETERLQTARESARAITEVREAEPLVAEDDRLARAVTRGDRLEQRPRGRVCEGIGRHVSPAGRGSRRSSRPRARRRRAAARRARDGSTS